MISKNTKDSLCDYISLIYTRLLGCSKATVRQHIDAYFEYVYPVPVFSFLHRAELLGQYTIGMISPALLLTVCGVSSRFLLSANERRGQARSWIEQAEIIIFESLGKATLANTQALMILTLYHTQNHQNSKAFFYLSLAIRMAYSLNLHRENSRISFLEQESRRRLIWCMFSMDRLQAGGIPVRLTFLILYTTVKETQLWSSDCCAQIYACVNHCSQRWNQH
jgi:hypothetical protein